MGNGVYDSSVISYRRQELAAEDFEHVELVVRELISEGK